ncbi:TetR/AcrR family transcriptional regulator [Sphingomonas oligophenolica]|uniref:TetR/AcrR family transcriptional regulator n=1 Tax=Sphingomonas oligophenolica TaxID=301154 RepID=A0ABU9Y9Z5_9SPHN
MLVEAARRLFAEKGFHATSTTDIVNAAFVTRGALQHYFPKKESLFRAVFELSGRSLVERTAARVANEGWAGLVADVEGFIENVESFEDQRIAFIDGPAVLGWAEWRRLQVNYGLRMMESAIADGISKGLVKPQPPRALAHLILSIVEEASLMVLNAKALEVEPEEVKFALLSLLSSLQW